jgi:hypothetical protein
MNISLRSVLAVAAVAAGVAVLPLVAGAQAAPSPAQVPESIAVPEGPKLFLVGHAEGVQIHTCNGSAWTLLAPRADLYDDRHNLIATQFGGPSWQAKDGSTVLAQRAAPPHPVDGTIPWLLLSTLTATAGPDGDRLAGTKYIQRLATTGGVAPTSGCNAQTAGAQQEVDYTADYLFWKLRGA